ncbi:MAG: hypothetical protein ABI625_08070 [bacterium]
MPTTAATLSFVPWVREGVATAIVAPDTLGAAQNAVVDISVALSVNGSSAGIPAVPIRLRGPADVVGIDAHQVIRVYPQPGTVDVEPTYFPCIEFDRPDYPWMFSPTSADATSKLRPWMCLIVVQKQPGVTIAKSPDMPLPTLQIASPAKPFKELPDLADCWAWAHAQAAAGDSQPNTVQLALDGPPEASLSRLIAPRVLAADTDYIACVVPTYEVGRKTGLGIAVLDKDLLVATAPSPLAFAWKTTQASAQLPVYYQWEFRTGASGDFQTLASKLRPEPTSATLGRKAVDISQPGFQPQPPAPPIASTAQLNVEGALQPAGRGNVAEPWDPAIALPFQQELANIVNAPATSAILTPGGDPLLAPPLYGTWHAHLDKATVGGTNWFDQLNLDPRLRTVAAYGTRVVQEHQEALMASAWEQAAEMEQGNQRMRQIQLSLVVNESIFARHINTLSDEATLRIAAPAFPRLRAGADNMVSLMTGATLPLPAVGAAMRRIGRQRGPLTRRMAAQGSYLRVPGNSWVAQLSFGMMQPPSPHGLDWAYASVITGPLGLRDFTRTTPADVVAEPKKPFWVYPEGQLPAAWPFPTFDNPAWPFDDTSAADFRRAALDHQTAIDPSRSTRGRGRHHVSPATTQQIKDLIQPRPAFQALGAATLSLGTAATPSVPLGGTALGVETVMVAPSFPQPMYEPLRDISQELLLPGLEGVPPDRIMGLETNRRFVEAFMVGLNFEMGRELLWRGFPTDQRGTYFAQFWSVAGSTMPRPDITPISGWGTSRALGDAQGAPAREQFVMLMRSALLRRYPDAVVCLTPAILGSNNVRMPDPNDASELFPVFSGSMKPDVSFFGFDISSANALTGGNGQGYYVVIQEHPTAPRFGLSVSVPATTVYVNANAALPAGLPVPPGLAWGSNAAQTAGIVRRPPIRLAIHTSLLIA